MALVVDTSVDHATGAARRRRERRLRAYLRYARMSVRDGPCRVSAPQRTAPEEVFPSRSSSTSSRSPPGCGPTCCWSRKGRRNECCSTPWSTLVPSAPCVQILDAPVPQNVDQLPNIVQFFAALSPVQKKVFQKIEHRHGWHGS